MGEAMKIDEDVPMTIPKMIATPKPRTTSPPISASGRKDRQNHGQRRRDCTARRLIDARSPDYGRTPHKNSRARQAGIDKEGVMAVAQSPDLLYGFI